VGFDSEFDKNNPKVVMTTNHCTENQSYEVKE